MNVIFAVGRRIALFGTIFLIVFLCVRQTLPNGKVFILLLAMPVVYLVFGFLTWLSAKHSSRVLSEMAGVNFPEKGFGATFGRAITIDLISPIGAIVDAIRTRKAYSIVVLIVTYCIALSYVILWFFLA